MNRRLLTLGLVLAVLALPLYTLRGDLKPWLERWRSEEARWFSVQPFPYPVMTYLYDLGVVDANGDGWLDLYTSNHNYRQLLLLADGRGSWRDMLSVWRLDQDPHLPGTEQHRAAPLLDRPGFYLYWVGDVLHLVLHKARGRPALRGSLHFYNRIELVGNEGFQVKTLEEQVPGAAVPKTRLDFTVRDAGVLRIYPHTRGTPITVELDAPWIEGQVYLGALKMPAPRLSVFQVPEVSGPNSPPCRWCQRLELNVRDRHALIWADYNADGVLDVFINRGALGGMLRRFPQEVRARVADELLISTGPGRFEDRAAALGLRKNDCSGRHARWVDFDRDGRLDLFVNCQDRGKAGGDFPKQLYRQTPSGRLEEVAAAVGLDLPRAQLVDLVWIDADGDGWIDLLTHEDTGFYLYRNQAGHFSRVFIGRGPFHRDEVPNLRGATSDYWQFDGKLSVADFDADGDLDAFMASKRGNALLRNEGGAFKVVSPTTLGLPKESTACAWVDYDNDGRPDLHCVPQGLYRQEATGRFRTTGMFRLLDNKYQAAIANWFDQDNDGRLDLLLAVQDNASLWRWWERPFKHNDVKGRDDRFDWPVRLYANQGPAGHWLQLELKGRTGNPQAIGAQVIVHTLQGRQAAQVGAHEGAYSSQGHYRLYFGLGEARTARVDILWPDGSRQSLPALAADRRWVIQQ
jgi:hypothetical protein